MPTPPFEILEHTADVGLRAFGATLPELFANAAHGMVALAVEPVGGGDAAEKTAPDESRKISAHGGDREELLVNFLSEVLYALDAERWRFSEFRIQRLDGDAIEAEGWGSRAGASGHTRVAVKAVTYHQVSVEKSSTGWEAVVYFDI
jgi:SHS2 domain-containing protein